MYIYSAGGDTKATDDVSKDDNPDSTEVSMELLRASVDDPSSFVPDLERTIPDLAAGSTKIRNQTFSLPGKKIKGRGKALGSIR